MTHINLSKFVIHVAKKCATLSLIDYCKYSIFIHEMKPFVRSLETTIIFYYAREVDPHYVITVNLAVLQEGGVRLKVPSEPVFYQKILVQGL